MPDMSSRTLTFASPSYMACTSLAHLLAAEVRRALDLSQRRRLRRSAGRIIRLNLRSMNTASQREHAREVKPVSIRNWIEPVHRLIGLLIGLRGIQGRTLHGAAKKTRTSTGLPPPAPQAGASTNSATAAHGARRITKPNPLA
jgi:hypothetical protein